ncbi:hypothetical protein [Neobacillus sp. DY30]|uniref:hypothetical protein n=1 Tax=Neobacillus sp. DY30 TaxID=3047871 RepID=UPI0024BF38A3|nr:hypothetical protein [Neobacillus sp. DY30]WHY02218.1 hypothetical protein QNH29_08295 [Neobacillus sp. DY30]
MNLFVNALSIVIVGVLAVSLVYTLIVARKQKAAEGHIDTNIPKPVQKHIYLSNPIFLSYGIFFVLVLFIILFCAITFTR